jgi:hypothetical protein
MNCSYSVGPSASRSVGSSNGQFCIGIGRTGFDTRISLPNLTLSSKKTTGMISTALFVGAAERGDSGGGRELISFPFCEGGSTAITAKTLAHGTAAVAEARGYFRPSDGSIGSAVACCGSAANGRAWKCWQCRARGGHRILAVQLFCLLVG